VELLVVATVVCLVVCLVVCVWLDPLGRSVELMVVESSASSELVVVDICADPVDVVAEAEGVVVVVVVVVVVDVELVVL